VINLNLRQERYLRVYPGFIRTEIQGLLNNATNQSIIHSELNQLVGITNVKACTLTERVQIRFESQKITVEDICKKLATLEKYLLEYMNRSRSSETVQPKNPASSLANQEVAATGEFGSPRDLFFKVPEYFRAIDKHRENNKRNIPWGLALSLGGLAVLGTKQLLVGSSALVGNPWLFVASSALSVITGYPFLKRGFRQLTQRKKWNSDLILGVASLSLAFVGENLLVLSGLSILQYIYWKHDQLEQGTTSVEEFEDRYFNPAIKKYYNQIGKIAFPVAAVTFILTRDPLKGLAVLLALNPRIAVTPIIATWKKAETEIIQQGGWIPKNGTIAQLANTKTLLIEDTSEIFSASPESLVLQTQHKEDDKIWCILASLLQTTNHPWRQIALEKANETRCTINTTFNCQEDAHGLQGKIKQSMYYFGELDYLKRFHCSIDPHLIAYKRLKRQGQDVFALCCMRNEKSECLGIFYIKKDSPIRPFLSLRHHLLEKGWSMRALNNSLQIDSQMLDRFSIDSKWLSMNEETIKSQIEQERKSGHDFLLLTNSTDSNLQAVLPSITRQQIRQLPSLLDLAESIQKGVDRQLRVSKIFNIIGVAMAIPFRASAMMINLVADAISLIQLSELKKTKPEFEFSAVMSETAASSADAEVSTMPTWFSLKAKEILAYFCVEKEMGLAPPQVELLKQEFGDNELIQRKKASWLYLYLGQFKEFTSLLLIGTVLLSILTGDVFHGIAIGVVLMANAVVGTIQEQKANKVIETLNQYQAPKCKVVRYGQEQILDGKELVPGDLIHLETGDRVPADIRLIQVWDLEVDESILTGESLPVQKTEQPVEEDTPLPERVNMVYMGTNVCQGRAIGIVVATGMQTEMGRLISLLGEEQTEMTPLQQEVTQISKRFVNGALIIAGAIFVVGLLRGNTFPQMIATSVALATSAIPEGLPVTVTIALSAGIFRMAKKSVLIRKLSALETLGRVNVICSDKTGTLTKNEMTVQAIATFSNQWKVTGEGYEPKGDMIAKEPVQEKNIFDLERLVHIATFCNNTKLVQDGERWTIRGNPTEGALLTFAHKSGYLPQEEAWKRMHELPFDSTRGKMSVVCKAENGCFVFTKGSFETLMDICSFAQVNGEVVPLTNEHRLYFEDVHASLSHQSMRVLALAYRPIHWDDSGGNIGESDFIFVGIAGMMDPPKPGISTSIQESYRLGIQPVMITGDHPLTAIAIAKNIGIHSDPVFITGKELDKLNDQELSEQVNRIHVFARVTPEQKVRIVQAYQNQGIQVAMTGDGVNDSPAIKQANVGIAMGQTGTDVTKEAADLVLEKDDFHSIMEAVKEGRTIMTNIRKALGCLLTGNLAEVLVTGVAVLVGLPLPLIPIQILLMNLLTDALPAVILATSVGNNKKQIKRIKIADQDLYRKVMIRGTLLGLGSLGLFTFSLMTGASLPIAQTLAFATLVIGQLIQTFSWRQEGMDEMKSDWIKDRYLIGALGFSLVTLLLTIYLPSMTTLLQTTPLSLVHWIQVLLVAGLVTTISKPIGDFLSRFKKTTSIHANLEPA
jgi:Ca2+-transporting ATPase